MTGDPRGKAGESRLETRTRQVFDASVERLDGATRSRLARARAAAVAAAERPRRPAWARVGGLELAGVGIAAALAVAVAWWPEPTSAPAENLTVAVDDLDILLDDEALDLFEELEFYAWLDAQSGVAGGDPDGSG